MKLRVSNWPFSSSEQVVLHWLRSPRMEGDAKQWVMTAVFQRSSGELVDVDVPWGMIASMQLGRVYQNGAPTDNVISIGPFKITFPDRVDFKVQRAGDVLAKSFYPLQSHDNLNEMCLSAEFARTTVVVPCLEIIRAFFCPNKTLAEAILTPEGLDGLVQSYVHEQTLRMQFSGRVPYTAIRVKYVVALIAQILYQDTWYECERQKEYTCAFVRFTWTMWLKVIQGAKE